MKNQNWIKKKCKNCGAKIETTIKDYLINGCRECGTIQSCENTDCQNNSPTPNLKKVMLKKEFDYDICLWCDKCIKRDKDMIKRVCKS